MIRATDEPTVAVLDLDQAELALNPTRTRVSAPIGVPCELETPSDNRKQMMFGAVNSLTGQTHFALTAHKRSADFQQFVDHGIIPAYPEAYLIFLIVDGASIHDSKSTRAWLVEHPQSVLVPLPSNAPKLNLQEHPWHLLRHNVTHSHYLGSLAAPVGAAKRFFATLAKHSEKVLQRIGMAVSPLDRHLAKLL